MATLSTLAAFLAVFVFLPLVILFWVTESPKAKAQRMRRNGHKYRFIAKRCGRSVSTVHAYCKA